jgi:hypothetical protein
MFFASTLFGQREFGLLGAFKFRNNAVGEHFAQFNAPLVERVDVPDGALQKNLYTFVLLYGLKCARLSPNAK